jgi:monoterpene epsilon-lactone hydrolase
MTLSLRTRFWRAIMRKGFKDKRLTIAENRLRSTKTARFMTMVPKGVGIEKLNIDGIPSEWISPSGVKSEKVILHLHGGGYVTGGINSHQMMCVLMAQTLKMSVLLPEYRLAPEHPFPAALDDALKVYRWLLAKGHQPADILLSGDSAGGGLSLALVLSLRDAGEPLPAALLCMSPWTDLALKGGSYISNARAEAVLQEDALREWAACYFGQEKPEHPLISPLYADFHGFPPLLIQVGSQEILLDDARNLAQKARADGVDVTLKIWEGMWHDWQALGSLIPESRQAFEEFGMFLHEKGRAWR